MAKSTAVARVEDSVKNELFDFWCRVNKPAFGEVRVRRPRGECLYDELEAALLADAQEFAAFCATVAPQELVSHFIDAIVDKRFYLSPATRD